MLVLALFALLSGAVTAITPCVLPVLPALLSASASGGRRRVVGVIGGVFITFTIAIIGLASVVDSAGVADSGLRTLAIIVLAGFGLTLLLPSVAARIEAPLSRLAKFGPKDRGDGFWSGLVVGGALGFVFAPCASPILAAVISVGATQGVTLRLIVVAVSFSLGTAAVLSVLAFGGRRLGEAIRRAGRGPLLQRSLGVIMIATALAMATDTDLRFQSALADHLPSWLVTPTQGLENSHTVQTKLADLRGNKKSKFAEPDVRAGVHQMGADGLPDLGVAPDFTGTQKWFNTANGQPISLKQLRGKVVLVDFWTYTCINCIRTLPYLKAWDQKYRDKGLVIVGVHTPEFSFEHDAGNVQAAIQREGIRYPVVQDNDYKTWDAYGNQYWPAHYLIDATGHVRDTHFGEGGYKETEKNIRTLLAEPRRPRPRHRHAHDRPGPEQRGDARDVPRHRARPGLVPARRAQRHQGVHAAVARRFRRTRSRSRACGRSRPRTRPPGPARASSRTMTAKRVFLVMSSQDGKPRKVRVYVDGRAAPCRSPSRDQRALPGRRPADDEELELELKFDDGI